MTIGYRSIKPAYRLSIYLPNNKRGHRIYKVFQFLAKLCGRQTRKRYRSPVQGARYRWGGSLRGYEARCFAVYFNKNEERRWRRSTMPTSTGSSVQRIG